MRHILGQPFGRTRDLIAAPIIERDCQMYACVMGGRILKLVHKLDQLVIQPHAVPDETNPHAELAERAGFFGDVAAKQRHQPGHFDLRAFPILGREGKDRQILHPDFGASFHDLAHTLGPGVVAEKARPPALGGPASVAVHDNCHMPRAAWLGGGQRRGLGFGTHYHGWSRMGSDLLYWGTLWIACLPVQGIKHLNLHDFRLFRLERIVDGLDLLVGQLLNLRFPDFLVIL